jgi:hypothetical protein
MVAIFPCFLLLALPLGLLIGSMVIRGAVSLANRNARRSAEPAYFVVEDDDDWGDYPLPGRSHDERSGVIPMPGIGKGMGIMLCILVVNALLAIAIRVIVAEDEDFGGNRRGRDFFGDAEVVSRLAALPIGFLVTTVLLCAMLPTRFGRACFVALYCCLICIATVFVVGVPLFAVGVAVGIR